MKNPVNQFWILDLAIGIDLILEGLRPDDLKLVSLTRGES